MWAYLEKSITLIFPIHIGHSNSLHHNCVHLMMLNPHMFLKRSTCLFLIRWRHPVLLVMLQQQKYYFPGVRQNLDNNEDKIIFSQIIDKMETRPSKSLLLPTCHATHLKLSLVYQIKKKSPALEEYLVNRMRHWNQKDISMIPQQNIATLPSVLGTSARSDLLFSEMIPPVSHKSFPIEETLINARRSLCMLLTLDWVWSILPEKLPLFHSSP